MSRPLQIGITGGIGSGKSLICKVFKCLGAPVYDSDSRAKSLMTTDGILMSQIRKEFGDLSYDDHGLNRQFLAKTVFGDEERLERLNQLVHPRVGEDYQQWLSSQGDKPYVLKEAALLFESGSYKSLDKIIVVVAHNELRIRRVMKRDPHRSYEQIQEIISRQWSEDEKRKRADYVIFNDESQLVIPQVLELHHRFVLSQR